MKRLFLAVLAMLWCIASPTAAQPGPHRASVGYTVIDADGASLGTIAARYNRRFSSYYGTYIGVEAEVSHGVKADEVAGVDIEAKLGYGAYGMVSYPLPYGNTDVYLRVGYASADIEAEVSGLAVSEELTGLAYGVGGTFMVTDRHGVRLDYTRIDGDSGEVDTYGASYVMQY